jgi:predicted O-methyltransferase YrrM
MTPLCALALKYDTDKCPQWRGNTGHEYTPFYHNYLFRNRIPQSVLEIGVCTGASLRMWSEYWPQANIIGIDNVPQTMFRAGRIVTALADQGSRESLQNFKDELVGAAFDIIIDDGSHVVEQQILSAQMLIPMLAPCGIFVIEDVQQGTQERIRTEIGYPSDLYELKTWKRSDNRLIVVEREA